MSFLVFLISDMVTGSKKELLCYQRHDDYMCGQVNIWFSDVKLCVNSYNNQLRLHILTGG